MKITDKKTYQKFGEFVKAGRKKRGLYQRELAEMIGTSQEYIAHIEKGTRGLNLFVALNICDALNLNFNDFLVSLTKAKPKVIRPEQE